MNFAAAAAAYGKSVSGATEVGMNARDNAAPAGSGFADELKGFLNDATQTLKGAESTSMGALQGKGDILDVIHAVQNAEMTLNTIVTVRDKVVGAYQEILRMPI
jgi:flagellar hook-basal body complex protein FliE